MTVNGICQPQMNTDKHGLRSKAIYGFRFKTIRPYPVNPVNGFCLYLPCVRG